MTDSSKRVHKKDTCWYDFTFNQFEKKKGPEGEDGVEINKWQRRKEVKILGVNFSEKQARW